MTAASIACTILLLAITALGNSATRAAETKPVVLVVGASGDTGLEVMRTAAALGLHPRGMTRNARQATQRHPNYTWVEADARDTAAVARAMRDASFVICALGAPAFDGPDAPQFIDYQGVAAVVDAAAAAKVSHFVLISSASAGPDREPRKTPRLGYVLLWKTLGENHLKASGIPYTIIGPAGLTDDPPRQAGLEAIPRAGYQSTNVSRADVARVALDALSNPAARGKSFALINTDSRESERWRAQLSVLPTDSTDLGSIENLAWLAGHWTRANDGATSEELWLPADAGVMLGLGRSISSEGRREFEWLRIEERADGVYYIAAPNGRSATEFRLVTLGEAAAVFHNPAHDFPNKLSYKRQGSVLSVTIEGTSRNEPASMSWQWTLQQPLRAPYLPPVAP